MTLIKGQSHRSRSNVQKLTKIYEMGHISDAISPTDFILGTKVQPNAFNDSSADDLDRRSRSKVKVKFSQKWEKTKELVISRKLFHLQTSYLVPRYNPIVLISMSELALARVASTRIPTDLEQFSVQD